MSTNTPLSDLRKSYEQGTLEEHDSASEPERRPTVNLAAASSTFTAMPVTLPSVPYAARTRRSVTLSGCAIKRRMR